ncbi:MAG: GtrA family protein [Actinomycetota bacterium]
MIQSIINAVFGRRATVSRYLVVSVINVINHQVLLNLANSGWGWSGGRANVFAAVISAIPGYLISRYWVWQVKGGHSLRAEIVPFWTLALIGLLISTVLAEAADRIWEQWYWVAGASLFGYFLVWVAKFFLLDTMFKRSARRIESDADAAATTGVT